jgi:pimeloyl-ACP methyl ester carboxylesterase
LNNPFFIELDSNDPGKVELGTAFKSSAVQVHDASIHCVSGGSGPAIIFLHGFSQDWYEFSQVMCLLANRYTVIAIDLRGIGKSKATRADYDAETLANDLHELAGQLAIKDPYIVGHDMGGMIAYAYARLYPAETRGIAILDGPLPGTPSTDLMVKLPFLWHFTFHRIPKLPEWLIGSHAYTYFKTAFFRRFAKDKQAMSDAVMRHYASAYTTPEQLRAGLGLYRTYRKNQAFMRAHRDELHVPILLLEGDYGSGKPGPTARELANKFGCRIVTAQVMAGCGHFMTDEQPNVIADLLVQNVTA